ncbi:nitroreductase family protein [Pseudidiomarina aestuarii]|uniref:nitroreductase family protein n=1 Tax=Pseudidiomarina aestuarii TaxID=624146 RepID=UPI003A973EDC
MSVRSLARRLLPATVKAKLHALYAGLNRRVITVFAGTRWTSSLFYALFSREFSREHQAVLRGRIAYWRSLSTLHRSSALLRRNTHRLEKGLIMRPRRASFAEAYIEETVRCFVRAKQQGTLEHTELKWAEDVLTQYFAVVEDTPIIARARAWYTAEQSNPNNTPNSVPYPHAQLPQTDITPEQLKQLYIRRRSVRWYLDKPVPAQLVEEAISMAALAPSACNRQPYQFYFINEPERAAKVAGFAGGTVGFNQNLQSLIVVVGDLNAYPTERDRHCIYIDGSLAAMQLMLALETMGLSTCPINWPDIEHREQWMAQELDLNSHQRPIMLMALGYADPEGGIPYSAKKPASDILKM